MNYSKDTIEFARDLVSHYAKWDTDQYLIDLDDIPDFERHEFAVKLMSEDESWASEATGPDNPAYDKKMMPALTRYLKNSTDRDEEIEFVKEWREGVTFYFHRAMREILDDICGDRLHDEMSDAGYHAHQRPDNGELYWSRHL